MSTYTVHQPPRRQSETAANPDHFVFVRDGFYFWAFSVAPLWMLIHRLWLVLLASVVLMIALHAGFWLLGVTAAAAFVVDILIMLLIGIEASTLWRWTLNRRGWKNLGVVVGHNREDAERRFFHRWTADRDGAATPRAPVAPSSAPVSSSSPSSTSSAPHDIIGLFPQPRPQP